MKRLLIPLALALSLHRASASLPYFDPFGDATANGGTSYTAGSALAGQQNNSTNIWNAVNTVAGGPQPLISAGSLSSYPNLPPSSGNSVSFTPALTTNQSVRLNFFATMTNGATYYSYLLKLTDISAVPITNANNFFAGFSDGSTAQPNAPVARIGTRILTKATNSGFVLGVGRNNTPSDYVYDTNVHNLNEMIFIVGSYELVGGVTNVNLWINPATNSFGSNTPPTPTVSAVHFTSTTGNLISTNGVQGFCILCQNANAPSGVIDELRIGTNWSSVTGGDPAILTQPANVVKPSGANATFTVVARGTPTLTYQWMKAGSPLSDVGNIFGSATATLTVSNISMTDVAAYSVFVTNGLGSFVQSSSATLALQTDPIVTGQPQSLTTNFGATAIFQVAPGGTSPFSYQWHEVGVGNLTDGGNILGSQSNTLVLSSVSYPDGGTYWVTVSNLNGTVDSSNATLTVLDPYFTTQPVSVTNNAGTTATFTVAAAGTGISTYQWFKNGNFIFDTGNLSGTATPTLTVSNVSSTDQAAYYATVVGSYSTATSSVANLIVLSPVAMAVQPSPRTVAPGVRVVFAASATGSGTLSYQWQLGGTNITNATSPACIVSNAQTSVAGNYQLVVMNSFSSITSSVATLMVTTNLTLAQTNLLVIRVGDGAQTLTVNGNSIYLDQYQTDGTYVNTITIPETGPNGLVDIGMDNQNGVNSGPTTGSCLTRSLDGRFMVIAGYNTNLTYGADLSQSAAASVPRGIGLIESHGIYTMPVADTSSTFNATYWRAGLTDGTNNFWGGGAISGTYYFGFDAPPTGVQTNMINARSTAQYNGNIYCAGATSGQTGVLKISGMPTGSGTASFLFAGSSGTFDMAVSPNGNLIYVVDQRALSSGGGIQRYDFNGSTWNLTYTLQIGGLDTTKTGPRYVTADFSGANPIIYVTSNDGSLDNNRIIAVVDTGSGSTGTTLANAGLNQTFRGIQFGPVANTIISPPLLSFTNSAGNLVLSWSVPFSLQSSTNALGIYTNVPGASSPYTNVAGTNAQQYFRLRQLE